MGEYYIYLIIFHGCYGEYDPIIKYDNLNELRKNNSGTMHLFDKNLVSILLGIEYLLHMPRLELDFYDLDEYFIDKAYDEPHNIIPIPDSIFMKLAKGIQKMKPTLVIYADDCDNEAKTILSSFKSTLGSYKVSELDKNILKEHWSKLGDRVQYNEYNKISNIHNQYIFKEEYLKVLPLLFLARQYNHVEQILQKIYNSSNIEKRCIEVQWEQNTRQSVLMELRKREIFDVEDIKKIYVELYEKEREKFNLNIVITFPGVPTQQIKYGGVCKILPENERRVIRIMGLHRAIANNGVLIELSCANEAIYKIVNEIEIRCQQGTNNKYVRKLLEEFGKSFSEYLEDYQLESLMRAKHITIFSDIPIGLAILENTEVPLLCYKKISYRPLSPLTRSFEIEMSKQRQCYLGKGCKIVFVECIIPNSENIYVRKMSELVRDTLMEMKKEYPNFVFEYAEIYTVKDIIKFINENIDADILYISAHGFYDREKNMSGLMVGNEFWMANENNLHVPSIVLLSACHVSPRGSGVVNVADLFIRAGAIAVLGTFIPVNAKRNTVLMIRLFVYILEAQKGNKQFRTLDEAWRGIVSSNAIHELMHSSRNLRNWLHGKNSKGKVRIKEFQLERCVKKLRPQTIYSDTINIIQEMLKEEGMEGKFGEILDKKNFFPESYFYQFIGYPENIFLYNEVFEIAFEEQKRDKINYYEKN